MQIIRAVSLHASASDPTSVSTRAFDEARGPAGHADSPQAKSIASRLDLAWSDVLLAAYSSSDLRSVAVRRKGRNARHSLSLEQVVNALRIVAQHRGQSSLTHAQYKAAREQIVERDRRGRHGGRMALALPSVNTITAALDKEQVTWEGACTSAGLQQAPGRAAQGAAGALRWDDAVGVFVSSTGHAPRSVDQIRRWAREVGVPLQDGSRPVQPLVGALQADRATAGLEPLPLAAKDMGFSDLPRPAGYGRPKPAANWNPATIVLGLAAAIRRIPSNQALAAADLTALRSAHPDDGIPSHSTVSSHAKQHDASFEQWRREAYELVRQSSTARS